jgi:hypothetical protein
MNIFLLKEFVNKSGSRIKGDYRIDQVNSMTTSPASPPVTTSDYVNSTRQGMSRYMYRSFYGENDETNDAEIPEEDKQKKYPKKGKKKVVKKLKESSKVKLDELINDIITKKNFDSDIINKIKTSELRLNAMPSLDIVKETNPILVRKVIALKDILDKNEPTGEELAIILNYILDTDMSKIPNQYKEELKKKIR